jgi:hypothetical protein
MPASITARGLGKNRVGIICKELTIVQMTRGITRDKAMSKEDNHRGKPWRILQKVDGFK